ncbi:MAG: DUF1415 domain-containing protein [Gammaproteobacteria bacterium]|nr:DUF1415 domain-containing protein [Gammaproteobacteria bacterium]
MIQKTKNWVEEIVIGLNLCPFASQPFQDDAIEYVVCIGDSLENHLRQLADDMARLDSNTDIETSLLIYPDAYQGFDNYLDMLDLANQLLEELNYIGSYQIASFHPDYRFEGSTEDDASNFSNRSPFPMLHLIRENRLEKAIANYPNVDQVPENNIKKLRDIGYQEMQDKLKKITT